MARSTGLGILAVFFAFVFFANGCGSRGPETYHVSGTVTLEGKPVPAGSVLFEPDQSKGNKGPAGFAKIKDGKFDTRAGGRGTVGGPHVVKIMALDGVPAEEMPEGTPLAPEYTTQVDLPKKEGHQLEFNIPRSASSGAPSARGQPDV